MTDVLTMLKSGDEKEINDYFDQVDSVDFLLNPTLGGDPLTAAWAAAFIGAPTALRILLQRGADVEFFTNKATVRRLCLIKQECLPALFEAGLSPNTEELMIWFYSRHASELPSTADSRMIHDIIIENPCSDPSGSTISARDVLSSEAFRNRFAGQLQSIKESKTSKTSPEMRKLLKEIDAQLEETAQTAVDTATRALKIIMENAPIIEAAVRRHFGGYKKNRKWLEDARSRASREICEQIAPSYDVFEDDEEFVDLINLALLRYPVRSVAFAISKTLLPLANDGRDFEENASAMLESAGYTVRRVGGSGDQGADLIAQKDGLSYAIQCKDYSSPVGNSAVQQALAAKAYYKSDYAVLCAANGFTKSAKTLAVSAAVMLVSPNLLGDLDKLRIMVD